MLNVINILHFSFHLVEEVYGVENVSLYALIVIFARRCRVDFQEVGIFKALSNFK